jgi:LuxR family maltose regulon positive regulatory protein
LTLPLLTTKIHIPPVRSGLVSRPALLRRLDEGLAHKLVLISAPAGFGKTTLAGEWARQMRAHTPARLQVAWLSVDEADNDPARFIAYLVAALRAALEPAWQDVLEELPTSQVPPQEEVLTGLINQVAAIPQQLALVLDDYHLITAQAVHDALVFLLDHLPDNFCLIIASRSDPPLPLPRLRARGQLLELRQADLRLTPEETAAFLNQVMGLGLSPEDVTALEARTEGWVAGLQMAALAMRGLTAQGAPAAPETHVERTSLPAKSARSEFVRAFTGSHRFILDYLMEEVLEQQPPEIQEFLLTTSLLRRLSGPLCDFTRFGEAETARSGEPGPAGMTPAGHADSRSILESLDAANLFIVPLDDERRWYRYHRLFSDLLRKRLRQTHPDLVPVLHRRASEWHEVQGMVAAAIDHALAAEDFERAADLIEGSVEATFMRSEVVTFLHWMERLPDEWARTSSTLCFYHAWAILMSGGPMEVAEQRLQDVACLQEAAGGEGLMPGRMAALRAYTALFRADTARSAELCREALETLPESDLFLRGIVGWLLSLSALYDGDLEDAEQVLQDLARKGQEVGNPLTAVTALCYQARLQVRAGHLHRAGEILERALQLGTDPQGRQLPIASEALIGLGGLWGEWNDLEAAESYLLESIELAKRWSELASFDAYIPLVRIRTARGDLEGAREAMATAQQIALRSELTEVDDFVVDLQRALFSVTAGDLEGATRWAEGRGLLPGAAGEPEPIPAASLDLLRERMLKYEQIVLVRLLIAQGRAAEALELLDRLLVQARELSRVDLIIEVQILSARAWQAAGNDDQAMGALAEALSLAEPGGWVLTFLDEGPAMANLLRHAASLGISPAYVASLLAAFDAVGPDEGATERPARPTQPLVEPLSERELEVLRLLSAGLSNPEIAEQLYIAVSTVRSHCKSIYGKLNVHKRWDAVHRAQELGLL